VATICLSLTRSIQSQPYHAISFKIYLHIICPAHLGLPHSLIGFVLQPKSCMWWWFIPLCYKHQTNKTKYNDCLTKHIFIWGITQLHVSAFQKAIFYTYTHTHTYIYIYIYIYILYFFAFIFQHFTCPISIINACNKTENWTLRDYCSCEVLSFHFSYTTLW